MRMPERMTIKCNDEYQLKLTIESLQDDFQLEGEIKTYFSWRYLEFWYKANLIVKCQVIPTQQS